MLNSEIDMIDEQNNMIEQEILKHEELGKLSEAEKEKMKGQLQEKLEEMKQATTNKQQQIEEVESQMSQIKSGVENMVKTFRDS